jgi:hypothetical protein
MAVNTGRIFYPFAQSTVAVTGSVSDTEAPPLPLPLSLALPSLPVITEYVFARTQPPIKRNIRVDSLSLFGTWGLGGGWGGETYKIFYTLKLL